MVSSGDDTCDSTISMLGDAVPKSILAFRLGPFCCALSIENWLRAKEVGQGLPFFLCRVLLAFHIALSFSNLNFLSATEYQNHSHFSIRGQDIFARGHALEWKDSLLNTKSHRRRVGVARVAIS